MNTISEAKKNLEQNGFSVIEAVYSNKEISGITKLINGLDTSNPIFRKTDDLFAIRQFIKEVPEIKDFFFHCKINFVYSVYRF